MGSSRAKTQGRSRTKHSQGSMNPTAARILIKCLQFLGFPGRAPGRARASRAPQVIPAHSMSCWTDLTGPGRGAVLNSRICLTGLIDLANRGQTREGFLRRWSRRRLLKDILIRSRTSSAACWAVSETRLVFLRKQWKWDFPAGLRLKRLPTQLQTSCWPLENTWTGNSVQAPARTALPAKFCDRTKN